MHANLQINIHPSTEKEFVPVHHRILTGSNQYQNWATARIDYDHQSVTWFLNTIDEIREFASKLESLSQDLFKTARSLETIQNIEAQANSVG